MRARQTTGRAAGLDVRAVRDDFPALRQQVHGKPLVYLDNAATSQKPQIVIDAVREYYETYNANISRGIHTLSEKATSEYERFLEIWNDADEDTPEVADAKARLAALGAA